MATPTSQLLATAATQPTPEELAADKQKVRQLVSFIPDLLKIIWYKLYRALSVKPGPPTFAKEKWTSGHDLPFTPTAPSLYYCFDTSPNYCRFESSSDSGAGAGSVSDYGPARNATKEELYNIS